MSGCKFTIVHNYSFENTAPMKRGAVPFFSVDTIDDNLIAPFGALEKHAPAEISTDQANGIDALETLAATIPAPRASPNSEFLPQGPPSVVAKAYQKRLPNIMQCQEWAIAVIELAVREGLLEGGAAAAAGIEAATGINP